MKTAPVDKWKAARMFPETYPGDRPSQAYLLVDDRVFPIEWQDTANISSAIYLREDGSHERVDQLLVKRHLPPIGNRYAVLSYGANSNPGTLKIKMRHYNYQSPGTGLVVPTFKGSLSRADVVACDLTGQGYLYADLLMASEWVQNSSVEVWVNLLDIDQLRVLNDSEGLNQGMYKLGIFKEFKLDKMDMTLHPLGYTSNSSIFISPQYHSPIAFKSIHAKGRTLPAMEPISHIDHLIDCFGLEQEIRRLIGLADHEAVAPSLMKYLNGQWWYQFNTGNPPLAGFTSVLELLCSKIERHSMPLSSANRLAENGLLLPEASFYNPGEKYLIKNADLTAPSK